VCVGAHVGERSCAHGGGGAARGTREGRDTYDGRVAHVLGQELIVAVCGRSGHGEGRARAMLLLLLVLLVLGMASDARPRDASPPSERLEKDGTRSDRNVRLSRRIARRNWNSKAVGVIKVGGARGRCEAALSSSWRGGLVVASAEDGLMDPTSNEHELQCNPPYCSCLPATALYLD